MSTVTLASAIARALGVDPQAVHTTPTRGGDVSKAAVAAVDGQRFFVKYLDPPTPGLLGSEAAGLRWLRQAAAVRIPQVIACTDDPRTDDHSSLPVLVLEHIETGRPAPDHDDRLGQGLAALHRAGADRFGAPWPGFVGPLPHPNGPVDRTRPDGASDDWPTFLAEHRWRPAARAAHDRNALPDGTLARLDRLVDRLPDLLGPPEPPARLHGDLWGGNAMTDAEGHPVLIDPAAFGGHREVDLGMMQLFGGFSPRVFAAYDEAHPLTDGHRERIDLYQLHPMLVHAALFGGGYGRRVRQIIDARI